ncbi:MAG: hydroxymethylglutaryl-CoA reductase (NADPH) [Candidatus Methanomethylophilus sp.]|nr:hydroxymethylglutaryl-CoA reductase (NADPH) [Methanomethylophilus sp.]
MSDGTGLKNRGHSHADVDERRAAVEQYAGVSLERIAKYCFKAEDAAHNVENMIGAVQIPLGYAGPIHIAGEYAEGDFLVPLATTEGALIASVSRGMSVITAAGGTRTKIFGDYMTRAPVFRVRDLAHTCQVLEWLDAHEDEVKAAANATTSHGKLCRIERFPTGRNLYLRFSFETGDAMGMNMATIASEAAGRYIEKETGAVMVSVSGNLCNDKKPAAINMIEGRGKTVVAEALIPAALVEQKLHTTAAAVVETNIRKNLIGSSLAGELGANAHAANMVAALYLATGQDPAQVVGGSLTLTDCEDVNGDLYISVRIPAVEVGTVGGGTGLPTQAEALSIIGCRGAGKARKFGEIVAATVLAGELSTLAAQAAGQLGKAHQELGRDKKCQ